MLESGMGSDHRIGKHFLYAGIGFGGSCFPKDIRALNNTANKHNYQFRLLDAVIQVNHDQKSLLFQYLVEHFDNKLENKKIAVWGLAFKPNTDDIREAPATVLIRKLLESGVRVFAYDPEAMDNAKTEFHDEIVYCKSKYDALKGADALMLITEWPEFRTPDFERMKTLLSGHVILDGRNVYDPIKIRDKGFGLLLYWKKRMKASFQILLVIIFSYYMSDSFAQTTQSSYKELPFSTHYIGVGINYRLADGYYDFSLDSQAIVRDKHAATILPKLRLGGEYFWGHFDMRLDIGLVTIPSGESSKSQYLPSYTFGAKFFPHSPGSLKTKTLCWGQYC